MASQVRRAWGGREASQIVRTMKWLEPAFGRCMVRGGELLVAGWREKFEEPLADRVGHYPG